LQLVLKLKKINAKKKKRKDLTYIKYFVITNLNAEDFLKKYLVVIKEENSRNSSTLYFKLGNSL
jgi:hypothetical protein